MVGSSNLSGRAKYKKGVHRTPYLCLKFGRAFELCCPKGNVRTEARGARRQAEPHSGDEAAKLPSNLSGRAIYKKGTRWIPFLLLELPRAFECFFQIVYADVIQGPSYSESAKSPSASFRILSFSPYRFHRPMESEYSGRRTCTELAVETGAAFS